MNCKECGNDIMLSIEPKGWKKIIRIMPLANYRCVRCGHTALRFTASGYRSTAFKILLTALVLASLGAAIWYSSQYYRSPAGPGQAGKAPVERRQVEPPRGPQAEAVTEPPSEQPGAAEQEESGKAPEQAVTENAVQAPAEKLEEPEKSPPSPQRPASSQPVKSPAVSDAGQPITLESVKITAEGAGIAIRLQADRPVEEFSQFSLDSPPRRVIDLPGDWSYEGPQTFAIGAKKMDRLRMGLHPDKLRLVIDLSAEKSAEATIEAVPHGLRIFLR